MAEATITRPTEAEAVELMRYAARKYAVRYGRAEGIIDDLEQEGLIGAVEACRTFDPSKGYKFTTYAAHRVVGRILDAMREQAISSRRQLRKARAEGKVIPQYVPFSVIERRRDDRNSAAFGFRDKTGFLIEPLYHDPEHPEHEDQIDSVLRGLGVEMSDTERRAVLAYFIEDRTMDDVAGKLGVSQSRVSQLIGGVLKQANGVGRLGGHNTGPKGKKHKTWMRSKGKERALKLGLSILQRGESAIVVRCPHCERHRRATWVTLELWAKAGTVPECNGKCYTPASDTTEGER